ncbi:murein L,D-transpeptidase family protein [uncultured Cohaesibacter sp.]|uniref:murein L,D-transpeptidase family protein n=1 Tax=uncultured Cohaesibacter sp. TaxID=1002546 RepID=UPI0029C7D7CE|nr:murein L,D-transpeptidase family protein [uncultured Cohaesibacter sp.]
MQKGLNTQQNTPIKNRLRTLAFVALAGVALAACNPELMEDGKHLQPLSPKIKAQIKKIGSTEQAPLYIRIFKEESVLEAWKQTKDGTYALLKTYPICAYSGEIGPKIKEGDRQAPEGFYNITPGQMNPKSSYYLSFNLGFPNKFDRSYGRTGAHLMVHGSCSSRGCYAMEDAPIAEIYALGREAFDGGQRSFQVDAFPFRMTPENLARVRNSEHFGFWQNIKNGYDHFQITKKPPKVEVCNKTYVFDPQGASHFNASGPCPDYTLEPGLLASLQKLRASENERFRVAVAELEQKRVEKQTKTETEMVDAQLDLLQRKQRISEGKNPNGFIAGLIKGNPTSETATAETTAATSETQTAAAETGQTGTFFSKLTKSLQSPFEKEQPAVADESTLLPVLPEAKP